MNARDRQTSFLGDLSSVSDKFLAAELRRWTRMRWRFVALLIVFVIVTAGLLLGLLGAGHRYFTWFGAFWILFCVVQIAMSRAYSRGYRRELDRRRQDGA